MFHLHKDFSFRVSTNITELPALFIILAIFFPISSDLSARATSELVEGSFTYWLIGAMPLFYSYAQAGQPFLVTIVEALKGWIAAYGPLGLFAAMTLASIISPIPNEVILVFAGIVMSPLEVAVAGAFGSTVGGIFCYYIALRGGRPLVEKFVKKETIASAGKWFARRGRWAILLARFIPFVPFDAVSYFAGLAKMKIYTFTILTFIGSVPRCLFYAYMGGLISEYNIQAIIIIITVIAIAFAVFKLKGKESGKLQSSLEK